jgi:hypothetical protein
MLGAATIPGLEGAWAGERGGDRRGPAAQQIDLDTLTAELLALVDQTMRPTRASLWLRPSVTTPAGRR